MTQNLPLIDYIEKYPQAPGYRDPDTSRAAAEEIAPTAALIRQKVFDALTRPMTAWEASAALNLPFETVQPRISELLADGKVKFTGEYGESPRSGKRVKKWVRL